MSNETTYSCDDFLAFQDVLGKMRKIDDNIIYAMNVTMPTDSFVADQRERTRECQQVWEQLSQSYNHREEAIKKCISVVSTNVKSLKEEKEKSETMNTIKQLKKEQTKLRLLQNELNIEEVVKDRSLKVFYERCRSYFKAPLIVKA